MAAQSIFQEDNKHDARQTKNPLLNPPPPQEPENDTYNSYPRHSIHTKQKSHFNPDLDISLYSNLTIVFFLHNFQNMYD